VSAPVAPGGPRLPSSRIDFGASALSAPTTPGNRLAAVDKSKVDPQIRKAAEGFEAMFLDYMMKVMRDTIPESEMSMKSPATDIYTSMQDSEMAQNAARAGGVGLADQIIAYMESQRYTLPRGMNPLRPQGTPQSAVKNEDTGGIDEGRAAEK
jgi:Rod binding domain-containing protein